MGTFKRSRKKATEPVDPIRRKRRRFWFRFFAFLAGVLCWLEEIRDKKILNLVVRMVITVTIGLLAIWFYEGHPIDVTWSPKQYFQDLQGWWPVAHRLGLGICVGFVVDVAIGQGLTPLGKYGRLALDFNEIGLIKVFARGENFSRIVHEFGERRHTRSKPVRVICISGKYLFQTEKMPDQETPTPLHSFALKGKIEAILPVSSTDNSTIRHRFDTYSKDFLRESGYESVDDLVAECKHGKEFLARRGNTLFEHDILCMWRVVLFSEHCIVQNYFPNETQSHSFLAPIFVFLKDDTRGGNYYNTFSAMFEMVKEDCTEIEANLRLRPKSIEDSGSADENS